MKTYLRGALLALASLLVLSNPGCRDNPSGPDPAVATALRIEPEPIVLGIGVTERLNVLVLDQHGAVMAGSGLAHQVVWESDDTTRIVIDETGLASGRRLGQATVRASAGALQVSAVASVLGAEIGVDQSRTVTATIGPDGGTMETQSAGGIRYRLDIPEMAVLENTAISVTPVTGFGNAPFLSFVAGVRFAPDGLAMLTPATLTIELPVAPDLPFKGIYFSDDGSVVAPWPVHVAGRTMSLPVPRFSGVGAADVSDPDALPTADPPDYDVSGEAVIAFGDLIGDAAESGDPPDIDAMVQVLRVWYEDGVRPLLTGAGTTREVHSAFAAWRLWLDVMALTPNLAADLIGGLGAEIDEARQLAGDLLRSAVQAANERCIENSNWVEAYHIGILHRLALQYALDEPGSGLDEESLLAGFCAQVHIVDLEFPEEVEPDEPAELVVRPGLGYGGGEPVESEPIRTRITPAGTTDDTPSTSTDPEVFRTVVPTGDRPLVLHVQSCLDVGPLPGYRLDLSKICTEATVTRNFGFSYFEDFEDGPVGNEWSSSRVTVAPRGQRFLGRFNNESVMLSFSGLPEHSEVTLEFDLYIIGSWNGNDDPDLFRLQLTDGRTLLFTSFSNDATDFQAYPDGYPQGFHPPKTGSSAQDALGYPEFNQSISDTTYQLRFVIPHDASSVGFVFTGGPGLSSNEVFGLDNVRVTLR